MNQLLSSHLLDKWYISQLRDVVLLVKVYAVLKNCINNILRYNSQSIQLTHLKYTVQWLFMYSQICAFITTIKSKTFSSPPKETSYLLAVTPHSLHTPNPGQPLICFLSQICPFWIVQVNGII